MTFLFILDKLKVHRGNLTEVIPPHGMYFPGKIRNIRFMTMIYDHISFMICAGRDRPRMNKNDHRFEASIFWSDSMSAGC